MIGILIVSFNPNISSLNKLVEKLLLNENVLVYIIDNNSKNLNLDIYNARLKILELSENMGIAFAQNQGISCAIKDGVKFIVFFDQDSTITENYINSIQNDYLYLQNRGIKVGAIGPRFIDERYGFYYKTVDISNSGLRSKLDVSNITEPLHSSLLISSGSFVSVETLQKVGFMRENYFIDYVDTEWCIRAESLGYKNYVSSKTIMQHAIGDNILQFRWFNVPVHSPFRRYYRVRNALYLLRESHVPILLVLREMVFNLIHQIILVCYCDRKVEYVKSYLSGLKDGLFGYKSNN